MLGWLAAYFVGRNAVAHGIEDAKERDPSNPVRPFVFRIRGRRLASGEKVSIDLQAANRGQAQKMALEQGIYTDDIMLIDKPKL